MIADAKEVVFSASAQEVDDCMTAIEEALEAICAEWGKDTFEISLAALNGDIAGPHETIN